MDSSPPARQRSHTHLCSTQAAPCLLGLMLNLCFVSFDVRLGRLHKVVENFPILFYLFWGVAVFLSYRLALLCQPIDRPSGVCRFWLPPTSQLPVPRHSTYARDFHNIPPAASVLGTVPCPSWTQKTRCRIPTGYSGQCAQTSSTSECKTTWETMLT